MLHPPLDHEVMIKAENKEFSRKNVEALAEWQGNPDWMRQIRLSYFELFENLPMPGRKDEEWRRVDISGFEYHKYLAFNPDYRMPRFSVNQLPKIFTPSIPEEKNVSGLFIHFASNTAYKNLAKEFIHKGVIWTDFKTAVREYPELVQKYYMKSVDRSQENKFTALNAAFWNSGMFLYIPKNLQIDLPLHGINFFQDVQAANCPHTMIVLDQGASVTYFEEFASAASAEQAFLNGIVEIFVEQGAKLQYISLQNLGTNVYNFAHRRAVVHRDASMNWIIGTFGAKLTKSTISSILKGEGAETQMLGISIGEKGQFIDQNTHQLHEAPHTRSDLLFKNAVKERGHTVYRGVIRIAQHAQHSDAYQANRNLMLGDHAKAESIPALEIIANDVRCTHGATVGKIDPEQLFYLQSRGLPRAEAKKLLVYGFFFPVLQHISHSYITNLMNKIIEEHTRWEKI